MPRSMALVDRHHHFARAVPEDAAKLVEDSPDSAETMTILRGWRDETLHLRCECRLVFHTVERDGIYFLRRNPKQPIACQMACGIGQNLEALKDLNPFKEPLGRPDAPLGLILRGREIEENVDSDPGPEKETAERKKPDPGMKFRSMFWTLYTILERIGLTGWNAESRDWDWNTFWEAFHAALGEIQLHKDSKLNAADIAWCPTQNVKGLAKSLVFRIAEIWDLPKIKPEAWVFFIIERIDPEGFFEAHRQSPKTRERKIRDKEPIWTPISFTARKHQMSLVGRTGPFLGFAVATVNQRSRQIEVKRVALQAIAAPNWPLPVESGPERDTAFSLWRLGIPFLKPVFGDGPLRPDFVLPGLRTILEVQGLDSEEYRKRKAGIHRRLFEMPEYRGWELLTFDVNNGETIKSLQEKLRISKW